jgi:hypothetical protein
MQQGNSPIALPDSSQRHLPAVSKSRVTHVSLENSLERKHNNYKQKKPAYVEISTFTS